MDVRLKIELKKVPLLNTRRVNLFLHVPCYVLFTLCRLGMPEEAQLLVGMLLNFNVKFVSLDGNNCIY